MAENLDNLHCNSEVFFVLKIHISSRLWVKILPDVFIKCNCISLIDHIFSVFLTLLGRPRYRLENGTWMYMYVCIYIHNKLSYYIMRIQEYKGKKTSISLSIDVLLFLLHLRVRFLLANECLTCYFYRIWLITFHWWIIYRISYPK